MIYIVDGIEQWPQKPLLKEVVYVFYPVEGARMRYTHVFANPQHHEALMEADFDRVSDHNGNAVFVTDEIDPDQIRGMLIDVLSDEVTFVESPDYLPDELK